MREADIEWTGFKRKRPSSGGGSQQLWGQVALQPTGLPMQLAPIVEGEIHDD
jgi:hypothetical protein